LQQIKLIATVAGVVIELAGHFGVEAEAGEEALHVAALAIVAGSTPVVRLRVVVLGHPAAKRFGPAPAT
jgi:hypothetical protein